MNATIIAALVRHILTALAGGFAVKFSVDADTMNAIVSGAAAAAGVGWSVWDKRRQ
jgi:O-antigen/teichoic acid export membrane protein